MKRLLSLPIAWLVTIGCMIVFTQPSGAWQDESDQKKRDEKIAEIQKQITELQKQLDQMKQAADKPAPQPESPKAQLPEEWVKQFKWRSVGPAAMAGRITAIAVCSDDPSIYWAATASGGLIKTVNNGVTFEHQFDHEATVSIGDVCVAPSDKNIVWVGTGENNPRNSVSYGDGVYKSVDGGKTWQNMGLKESFQIGRIAIHPKNPDIVYVGALGRLYGPNPERGLFKTTDGGKTWQKILYKDENTGVIDIAMHPTEPDTLLVAMWERKRDEFDASVGEPRPPDGYDAYDPVVKWGEHAGIYKTTDGGKSFTKLSKGLPSNKFGRVGLDYYRKNPNVVYAIVDCEKIGMGTPPPAGTGRADLGFFAQDTEEGMKIAMVFEGRAGEKAGLKIDDVILTVDDKKMPFSDLSSLVRDKKPEDKLKIKYQRDKETKEIDFVLGERPESGGGPGGGGSPSAPGSNLARRPYTAFYGGQRENVQDRQGKDGHEFGGVYRSEDGGESWTRVNSFNPRPMYFSLIRVDPQNDQNVYIGGVNMHKSTDGGKTFRTDSKTSREVHSDYHAMWINPKDPRHILVGTDGGVYVTYDQMAHWDHLNTMALGQFYHVCVDSRQPYWVYGGLQDNGSWGGPTVNVKGGAMFNRSGEPNGPINEDWLYLNGGDGFVCRVDWNDPDWVYCESQGGMMVRRNLKTGERGMIRPTSASGVTARRWNWNTPFILSHHNSKVFYCAGEYVFRSFDRGNNLKVISPEITLTKKGSATALSESPRNPEVLWVGSDDGAVFVTRDGGKQWTKVNDKVGLAGPRWVATIEASHHVEGRAYVCFDAHRSNDDDPHIYVTEDFGQTWKSIRGNLPRGSSRCLREDPQNPDLLFCGTEFAIFASVNRGKSWTRINNNLPTVAIHEVAIHPTAEEIAVATHGRSIWILDVAMLRQVKEETFKEDAVLFKPATVTRWRSEAGRGGTSRRFVGENPVNGAPIYYFLPKKAEKVTLRIMDHEGKTIREISGSADAGLNKVVWNLTRSSTRPTGQQPPRRGGQGGFAFFAAPGNYLVVLDVDKKEARQTIRVEGDPNLPAGGSFLDEVLWEWEQEWLEKQHRRMDQ